MTRSIAVLTQTILFAVALVANPVFANRDPPRSTAVVKVDWEDGKSFTFQEVSGLGMQVEILEFRDGGEPKVVHKLPGRVNYPNVVLKCALAGGNDFWQWIESARTGALTRKNMTITLLDSSGEAIAQFQLLCYLPARWTVETEQPNAKSVFIEQVELATEFVDRLE